MPFIVLREIQSEGRQNNSAHCTQHHTIKHSKHQLTNFTYFTIISLLVKNLSCRSHPHPFILDLR